MKKIDIYVLLIVLSIVVFYFLKKKIFKKTRENYNSLFNYERVNLAEDHGSGMYEGNDEVHVYSIAPAPIAGPAGQAQASPSNVPMPVLGFKPSEVRNIPNFERAIKNENGIEYVDNSLMVPLIYHIVKRMVLMLESFQNQISECCY